MGYGDIKKLALELYLKLKKLEVSGSFTCLRCGKCVKEGKVFDEPLDLPKLRVIKGGKCRNDGSD